MMAFVDRGRCSGRVQGHVDVWCNKRRSATGASTVDVRREVGDIGRRIQSTRNRACKVQEWKVLRRHIVVLVRGSIRDKGKDI